MISDFLEKNSKGFNYGNFIVKKIHAFLILMVLVGFAYFLVGLYVVVFFEAVFSIGLIYSLLIEARKKFPKDFKYFLLVYGLIYLVIQLMWINNLFLSEETRMDFGFLLIFVLIAITVFFSVLLKKNSVQATVLSSNGKITVVETEFDLRSFTKGGKHIIETGKKLQEESKIQIKIQKGIFGKRIEIL